MPAATAGSPRPVNTVTALFPCHSPHISHPGRDGALTFALCVPPTAYNKWHETELERWLSDHDIPYPTPADRKDLEKLIQSNWDAYAVSPYKNWDNDKLTGYLQQKGVDVQDAAQSSKDSLVAQVAASWYETEDKAQNAYFNVRDWILDTWTESQLKAFCDHHAIPGKFASISLLIHRNVPPTDSMQYRSLASVTPSWQRPAATTTLSLRRSARLHHIPVTGSTRLGLVGTPLLFLTT